jgi:hypothetical protein
MYPTAIVALVEMNRSLSNDIVDSLSVSAEGVPEQQTAHLHDHIHIAPN